MSAVKEFSGQYTMMPSDDQILAAAERILRARMSRGEVMSDPSSAGNFFRVRLAHLEHEEFHVMFLDTRHRIIEVEMMSRGTVDGAEVHPREIVKRALLLNCASIICAHNHPSSDTEPSAADRAVTARLKQALALVEVRLLDHFVVGKAGHVSLASRGWI